MGYINQIWYGLYKTVFMIFKNHVLYGLFKTGFIWVLKIMFYMGYFKQVLYEF